MNTQKSFRATVKDFLDEYGRSSISVWRNRSGTKFPITIYMGGKTADMEPAQVKKLVEHLNYLLTIK